MSGFTRSDLPDFRQGFYTPLEIPYPSAGDRTVANMLKAFSEVDINPFLSYNHFQFTVSDSWLQYILDRVTGFAWEVEFSDPIFSPPARDAAKVNQALKADPENGRLEVPEVVQFSLRCRITIHGTDRSISREAIVSGDADQQSYGGFTTGPRSTAFVQACRALGIGRLSLSGHGLNDSSMRKGWISQIRASDEERR